MDFYRLFAYLTTTMVVALLVLVSTQILLNYIQPDQLLGWLVWVMLILIYGSISFAVAKRFSRKPMRPPTLPLMIGPLMILPSIVLQFVAAHETLDTLGYVMYLAGIALGAGGGSWFGMKAGWNTLLQQHRREPS